MLKKNIKSVKPIPVTPKKANTKLFDLASSHSTVASPRSTDSGILSAKTPGKKEDTSLVDSINSGEHIITDEIASSAIWSVPALLSDPIPAVTFMSGDDILDVLDDKESMPAHNTVFSCTGPDYYVQGKMLKAVDQYVTDNRLDPYSNIVPEIANILRGVFDNTLDHRINLALNEFAVKVMAEARNWMFTRLGDDMYALTPYSMNAIPGVNPARPYSENDPFDITKPRTYFVPNGVTKIVNRYGSSEAKIIKELEAYLQVQKIRIVDGTVTNAIEEMFDNVVGYASKIIFSDFKKGVDEMEPVYCDFMDHISQYINGMYLPLYTACLQAYSSALEFLKLRTDICAGNQKVDDYDY